MRRICEMTCSAAGECGSLRAPRSPLRYPVVALDVQTCSLAECNEVREITALPDASEIHVDERARDFVGSCARSSVERDRHLARRSEAIFGSTRERAKGDRIERRLDV